ncbi:MAG: DUF91 domain-containing protein [Clostridia bacterium]|nr:DUF91 domain-containing protein [Clostridia bacterium]
MIRLKLWSLDQDGDNHISPVPVEEIDQTETENQLESILVRNPELLMPGLKLVGRQTPTEGGPLDLLGVDEDGNLIVFELKRGALSRDAVAQIIDYASFLNSLDVDTLLKHISDKSGHGGIEKIDFESWYQEQFSGNLENLEDKAPKMVLVGLGADERTRRMVNYLSKVGVDISLITFYVFKKGEQIFIAKQVEVELHENEVMQRQSYTKESNEENLRKLAARVDAEEILKQISFLIRTELPSAYEWPGRTGRSFALVEKTDEGRPTYRVYISLYLAEFRPSSVQLVLQPRAVEAAGDTFIEIKKKHKNLKQDNKNGSYSIWLKPGAKWEEFKDDFKILINDMEKGWQRKMTQLEGQG